MISVCLACYNGEKYIREQVLSILKQLSKEDELIIADNGSTDNTISLLRKIGDERIKIYFNLPPIGEKKHRYANSHYKVTKNFEFALNRVKGNFVFLSDQDDVWASDKVEITLKALKEYDLVLSNYSIINSEGRLLEPAFYKESPIKRICWSNIINMPFHGCCMAFRHTLLKEALPFPTGLIMHDNWIGLLACVKGYRVGFIDSPLVKYRRHQCNVSPSSAQNKNPLWFKLWYRIVLVFQLINRYL